MGNSFDHTYPHVTEWVSDYGWIELGPTPPLRSVIRALDEGGMVWEGDETYPTLDDALQAAEQGLAAWMRRQFGQSASRPRR